MTATDKDSGLNSFVKYFVDHSDFSINANGEISTQAHLDADQKQEGFYFYRFNVTAKNVKSPNQLYGTSLVKILIDRKILH